MGETTNAGPAGGALVPCILLMLQGGQREAGELRELVAAFGLQRQAVTLEATLQGLEADRLVCSEGPAGEVGANGHRFRLTAGGEQWLAARSRALAEPARLLARFLDRYASLVAPAACCGECGELEASEGE